jgi:hypothetical protein
MALENVMKAIVEDGGKTPAILIGTAVVATGAYLFFANKTADYYLNRKRDTTYNEGQK